MRPRTIATIKAGVVPLDNPLRIYTNPILPEVTDIAAVGNLFSCPLKSSRTSKPTSGDSILIERIDALPSIAIIDAAHGSSAAQATKTFCHEVLPALLREYKTKLEAASPDVKALTLKLIANINNEIEIRNKQIKEETGEQQGINFAIGVAVTYKKQDGSLAVTGFGVGDTLIAIQNKETGEVETIKPAFNEPPRKTMMPLVEGSSVQFIEEHKINDSQRLLAFTDGGFQWLDKLENKQEGNSILTSLPKDALKESKLSDYPRDCLQKRNAWDQQQKAIVDEYTVDLENIIKKYENYLKKLDSLHKAEQRVKEPESKSQKTGFISSLFKAVKSKNKTQYVPESRAELGTRILRLKAEINAEPKSTVEDFYNILVDKHKMTATEPKADVSELKNKIISIIAAEKGDDFCFGAADILDAKATDQFIKTAKQKEAVETVISKENVEVKAAVADKGKAAPDEKWWNAPTRERSGVVSNEQATAESKSVYRR